MTNLRDKIAWALYHQDYKHGTRRESDTAWLLVRYRTDEDSTWHRASDAVLAVLDLDTVRAEGYDRAWSEVRSIPHWWNPNIKYGEFDMLPLGPDETTEQGAFMAVREVLTSNPYRKEEQ